MILKAIMVAPALLLGLAASAGAAIPGQAIAKAKARGEARAAIGALASAFEQAMSPYMPGAGGAS